MKKKYEKPELIYMSINKTLSFLQPGDPGGGPGTGDDGFYPDDKS